MKLVSILIANRNNGKYIEETLNSAINQTYSNIEIIVIDDNSNDNSIDIINNFIKNNPQQNVQLLKNSDSKGCGRIKKQLIENSIGEYFAFLDPEDTIRPDAVDTLVRFHTTDQYSIVYSTHYCCNEKLETEYISTYPGKIQTGETHFTSTTGHISAFALCRRDFYNKTNGINPNLIVAEDQDLYMKLEEFAPVYYVDEPLYYYRKHENNMSWNSAKREINLKYKHVARTETYRRRKHKKNIPNLTSYDYYTECIGFHLQIKNIKKNCKKPFKAFLHQISAIYYLCMRLFFSNKSVNYSTHLNHSDIQ